MSLRKEKKKKLRIGFCGVFPPFHNGGAAGTYYILKELAKHDVEIFLIPVKNKIDKKLFSFMPLRYARVSDPLLDAVIFWVPGDDFPKYAKGCRCKKIVWQTMHNNPEKNQREQQTFDAVKGADLILGMTRWAVSCYKKQVSQVSYLPFGVDTSLFTPADLQTKQMQSFTCLFVSRIHYYKGIMPFLDAIPLVLKKDPTVCFKVIAPWDKYSPYLEEIAQRLNELSKEYAENISVNTNWVPYEKIQKVYQSSSVLIFPSNNEGFGIPLIEAMSAEIPCIVLNKKPMSEIVTDKITGFCLKGMKNTEKYHDFLFPDPKEIAKNILVLKHNSIIRKRLGKNGRKRVLEEYDLSSIITELVQHCKELTQK